MAATTPPRTNIFSKSIIQIITVLACIVCLFNVIFLRIYVLDNDTSDPTNWKFSPAAATNATDVDLNHDINSNNNQKDILQKNNVTTLNVTALPIINMGLMKSGTTSIASYFQCGLPEDLSIFVTHYDCFSYKKDQKLGIVARMACGVRLRNNLQGGRSVFDGMDQFLVYAELDSIEQNMGMTLPQWSYLMEIYEYFPQATWILNMRDPNKWLNSVNRWKDLRERFVRNRYGYFWKGIGSTDEEMIEFYLKQAEKVRDFVRHHPSLTLVEVWIDDPNAGYVMEKAFGIDSNKCWGRKNVNTGEAVLPLDM